MSEHTEYISESPFFQEKIGKYVNGENIPDCGFLYRIVEKYSRLESRLKMTEELVSQQEKMILSQNNKLSSLEDELNDLKQLLSGRSFMHSLSSETI